MQLMKRRLLIITGFIILIATMSTDIAFAASCPDGPALRQWRQQRQALLRTANIYRQAGIGAKFIPAYNRLERFTATFPTVFLEQEIRNYPLLGNTQCLLWAMNNASGQNLNLQTYSDGKFDLLVGSNKIRSRISAEELLSIAKSLR
jgi:hypothetical protein